MKAPTHKHNMFLDPVSLLDIIETTSKLKAITSQGHDKISCKLMKDTIAHIALPLSHIINLLRNVRPISLLTAFSKLLEKLMYDKIIYFLNSNNTLYKHQYGFMKKYSTIHPIIHLLYHCADVNNKHSPEITLAMCEHIWHKG